MLRVKQGNSFIHPIIVWADKTNNIRKDLTGCTIYSTVCRGTTVIENLTVTITDAVQGEATIRAATDTSAWAVAVLDVDILIKTATGQKISSETFQISCEKAPTKIVG